MNTIHEKNPNIKTFVTKDVDRCYKRMKYGVDCMKNNYSNMQSDRNLRKVTEFTVKPDLIKSKRGKR